MSYAHDPKKIGSGVWYSIHTMCASATTPERKRAAMTFIKILSERFACKRCRTHFNAYIRFDPPEQYINEEEGLFLWSFRCHNNANTITHNQQMNYEDASALYYGEGASCNKECGEEHEASTPKTKPGYRLGPSW